MRRLSIKFKRTKEDHATSRRDMKKIREENLQEISVNSVKTLIKKSIKLVR